jgi:hypothetical protein
MIGADPDAGRRGGVITVLSAGDVDSQSSTILD